MQYIKETVITGKVIEVTKKCVPEKKLSKRQRAEKNKETSEKQKAVNLKRAITKLRRILNSNYKGGDLHLVLTYRKNDRKSTSESRKELEKFLRKLRALYKKRGIELRYVTVTEYLNKHLHHHLVINAGTDIKEIMMLWPWGRPKLFPLDDTGQYGDLAAYLVKESEKTFREPGAPQRKRWNSSTNLKKPIVKQKIIKRSHRWVKEPRPLKGYNIEKDSIYESVQEETGYIYQFYSMVKIDERKPKKRKVENDKN